MASLPIQTVKTAAFSMDWFSFGQGKDALVILPGLSVQSVMGSADAIANAYRALARDFTVYVFDRRKEAPDPYSVYDMARDTASAIEALGIERYFVFGASQGGMIAQVLALTHSHAVRKMILGSTAAKADLRAAQTVEHWIHLAKERKAEELYRAFGEAVYPPQVFRPLEKLFRDMAKSITDEELDRFAILAAGIRDFDVTAQLKDICCPTLILGALDDKVLGAEASRLLDRSIGGPHELYLYDGCGHAAYDTAPDYKERMLRFLLG